MRVFAAIELPRDFFDGISEYLEKWQERDKELRWICKENIFIILAFIGELDVLGLELLEKAVENALADINKFDFTIGRIGYQSIRKYRKGDRYYHREIIKGFECTIDRGREKIKKLSEVIEESLVKTGMENNYTFRQKDKRPFSPHITIALKGKMPIENNYEILPLPFIEIKGIADTITVFNSELLDENDTNLQREIPKYTPIKVFNLK
jgi:2'-5' RNA ligase